MDLQLIGAGRHPKTKVLRQRTQPSRRTFWIGTLHIAPQKRFPVTVEFCKNYFDQIVAGINNGTVLVQHQHDKYVNPEELKILCFGNSAEVEAELARAKAAQDAEEAERVAAQAEMEQKALQAAKDAEEATVREAEAERVRQETEAALQAALAQDEAAAAEAAVVSEPAAEPAMEEPAAEPAVDAVADTDAPPAEEAPAAEPEPTPAIEAAPAAEPVELPKNWEELPVPELLKLSDTLNAVVVGTPSRKNVIKAIKAKVG